MKIQIISLFPEAIAPYLQTSMMRKATEIGAVEFELVDLRKFGLGSRRQVDDTPYGGGDGMVLRIEPLVAAVEHAQAQANQAQVILMTPRGGRLKQSLVAQFATKQQDLIIICGRYEGYDERLVNWVDMEVSIGNYVLTGGELPALVLTDAVVRLIPGVLGGQQSAILESFSDDKIKEHPHYTKPADFGGHKVPEVLLSGDHQAIEGWRQAHQK